MLACAQDEAEADADADEDVDAELLWHLLQQEADEAVEIRRIMALRRPHPHPHPHPHPPAQKRQKQALPSALLALLIHPPKVDPAGATAAFAAAVCVRARPPPAHPLSRLPPQVAILGPRPQRLFYLPPTTHYSNGGGGQGPVSDENGLEKSTDDGRVGLAGGEARGQRMRARGGGGGGGR